MQLQTAEAALYPNKVQSVGALMAALHLFAAYSLINDILVLELNVNSHMATGAGALAIVLALVSGSILRGLRSKIAWLWLAVLGWAIITIPFSSWRSGSLEYVRRAVPYHLAILFICALVVSPKQVRTLLYGIISGAFVLGLVCVAFGVMDAGRLTIPNTTLANPNELGLRLLLGAALMVFPLSHPNRLLKFAGAAGMLGLLALLFRTGSRGSFVAAIAVTAVLFIIVAMGRAKVLIAGGALIALVILLIATPRSTVGRLLTMFGDTADTVQVDQDADPGGDEQQSKAVASQLSRKELLLTAARLTIHHPLFGVGPGQFAQTIWLEGKERGEHVAAQRPHNSYFQISSEIGIPGLFFWGASLLLSLAASYRAYGRASTAGDRPAMAQSLGLFAYGLAYMANTLFIHVTFADAAPLVGLSIANTLAIERWFPGPKTYVPLVPRRTATGAARTERAQQTTDRPRVTASQLRRQTVTERRG